MRIISCCFVSIVALFSCQPSQPLSSAQTIGQVMDDVITRLYENVLPQKYDSIDDNFILNFLSKEEKKILATRYQYFTVNVPVIVSLMRHTDQPVIPFWLKDSGFKKTKDVIKNAEGYAYEVWEKKFDTGLVELGINGFDKHRPVYFISVTPQYQGAELKITSIYPAQFNLDTLKQGSFTYHDWSGLLLTEVPERMAGQILFTTVRGRAREAHVIGAFRKTPFPSSSKPDQVMLTWSGDTQTTMDFQWRTNTSIQNGAVRFWITGTIDTVLVDATRQVIQDRMLYNDRYIHRFTAQLDRLTPGTSYTYQVGSNQNKIWSDPTNFQTERIDTDEFSFIWFGDTHTFPDSGKLVNLTVDNHKDVSFYSIAGDIVTTGLYRDDWDKLFQYAGGTFASRPLMPVLGNHDRQDGLGAQLYYDLFSLPKNGPPVVEPEGSYSFEYGNSLFIMIDATSEVDDHTAWIEEKLKNTKATWKFVMFHFPPYNFEEPYLDIQKAWVPLFDQYHVDMVMGGHIHYYMRSKPMFDGKVVDTFAKGTVYAISISIPNKHNSMTPEPYAVTQYDEGYFYQLMEIKGKELKYTTVDSEGEIRDEFVIKK